jgi:hypothetical protein
VKTRIHVDQNNIKSNRKNGTNKPVFTVLTYKSNIKTNHVEILGPSKLIYSPDKPLNCKARVWIETEARVLINVDVNNV